jgi:hypothetical protein
MIREKAAVTRPEADHLKAVTDTKVSAMTVLAVLHAKMDLNPEILSLILSTKMN